MDEKIVRCSLMLLMLLFAGGVFSDTSPISTTYNSVDMTYDHYYCLPIGKNGECYEVVVNALTPENTEETISLSIIQNMTFSDSDIADKIIESEPSQLFIATDFASYSDSNLVVNFLTGKGIPMYFVDVLSGTGIYHLKTEVALKRQLQNGSYQYKLIIVSGSYNLTETAARYSYESLVTLKTDWMGQTDPKYYKMLNLAASYISRLYTKDQIKVLLAKAASIAYGASYSSTCDYFNPSVPADLADPALNTIDKILCN